MEKVSAKYSPISISYISVPEVTKKNRYHFHLLVYDLPPEASQCERKTRNLQRLFERGYIDTLLATYVSAGLAGYMSKYMGKALTDFKNEATRGFNCSRNIKKVRSAGSNSLSEYADLIYPQGTTKTSEYDVPFLGKCRYKKIVK
jgi:hypothetical protein